MGLFLSLGALEAKICCFLFRILVLKPTFEQKWPISVFGQANCQKWKKSKTIVGFLIWVLFSIKLPPDIKDFSIVTSTSYLYSRKESFIMNKLNYYAWYETKLGRSTSILHFEKRNLKLYQICLQKIIRQRYK